MKSMTGFGSSQSDSKNWRLGVNIRAVNGRFLEIRLHVPKEYNFIESEIKKVVGQAIGRGTVDLFISRHTGESGGGVKVTARKELARRWVQAYKKLANDLKLPSDLRLESIGDLSQILVVERESEVSLAEKKALLSMVKKAANLCKEEKIREGLVLKKDLQKLLKQLAQVADRIYRMRVQANKEIKKRFEKKVKSLGHESVIGEERMAQEVALLIEKSDISEEIIRLREHVQSCLKLTDLDKPQGKKMDFYSQELLREMNTIGAKSPLSQLTQEVVNAKSIIEKFREQVQNVE